MSRPRRTRDFEPKPRGDALSHEGTIYDYKAVNERQERRDKSPTDEPLLRVQPARRKVVVSERERLVGTANLCESWVCGGCGRTYISVTRRTPPRSVLALRDAWL